MDELIAPEMKDDRLFRLSEQDLSNYGYFLVEPLDYVRSRAADVFCQWLQALPSR